MSARSGPSGLALTFDDGPDPRGTPAVLDALARAGARATFFVIAPAAECHPAMVRRAEEHGHRVALHCDRHIRHSEMDEADIRADTERGLGRLTALGVEPTLWRLPWGTRTPASDAVAEEFGLTIIDWDVDTHDWRGDPAADMFEQTRANLRAGRVVLAHDGIGPGATRSDCAQTAAFIGLVAAHAAQNDVTLCTL